MPASRGASAGSSPLTRGKPVSLIFRALMPGLIPAHAGKTALEVGHRACKQAHPRSRGENALFSDFTRYVYGSSPLTRGKLGVPYVWGGSSRLIPAHAGKTERPRKRPGKRPAHPRSRGENDGNGSIRALSAGSSPLTRGKRICKLVTTARRGLIPAHAGKTGTVPRAACSRSAHPRSRGENLKKSQNADRPQGSSPLTRGKHTSVSFMVRRTGLIPAHAGKTLKLAQIAF